MRTLLLFLVMSSFLYGQRQLMDKQLSECFDSLRAVHKDCDHFPMEFLVLELMLKESILYCRLANYEVVRPAMELKELRLNRLSQLREFISEGSGYQAGIKLRVLDIASKMISIIKEYKLNE